MLEIIANNIIIKIHLLFNKIFRYRNNLHLLILLRFNLYIRYIKSNIGKTKAILFLKYSPYIIPIKYPNCAY